MRDGLKFDQEKYSLPKKIYFDNFDIFSRNPLPNAVQTPQIEMIQI